MEPYERLVLGGDQFSANLRAFYANLNRSAAFRAAFVNNPAEATQRTLLKDIMHAGPTELSRANRVLFSMLSNPAFMTWSPEYEAALRERIRDVLEIVEDPVERLARIGTALDRATLYQDIARAMLTHGDAELLLALAVNPSIVDHDPDLPQRP